MTQLTMGINKWEAADNAFDRGLQAWLDWCRELAKLAENLDTDGKPLPRSHIAYTTQEDIAARYGKERVRITEAIAVGRDQRFVLQQYKSIPKAKQTVYLLSTLPDKEFGEYCKPTTTHAQILEVTRRLAAPKPEPTPQRPPCPGVEGIGPGCWKWSHAFGEWVQEATHIDPKPSKEALERRQQELKAKNTAAQNARHASFDASLKGLLDQTAKHMPTAVLDDASPIEFLTQAFASMLQYGGVPAAKLAKQMFSSAYHPDSGRVKHDADLMGSINKALLFLEK